MLEKETRSEKVIFLDEPGSHNLVLTIVNAVELKIEIFWSDHWETETIAGDDSDLRIVYEDIDTLQNFAKTFCAGIKNLLVRTPFDEYKEQWHAREFPKDRYDRLSGLIGELD